MRKVAIGETPRVYFNIKLLDNVTPALAEAGGQPQISINGNSFTNNHISTLAAIGYGKYYAELTTSSFATGDIIQTRYKSGITSETDGDSFIIGEMVDSSLITSYGNITQADLYFSNQLNVNAWIKASNEKKRKALIMASQIIDRLNFYGDKTDVNQLLEFPRNDETVIPENIFIATYIIALKLLEGYDPDIEASRMSVEMSKYDSVQTYFDRASIPEWVRCGIPSQKAWAYLKPYLVNPRELTLSRV